jgi:hypothetical protein
MASVTCVAILCFTRRLPDRTRCTIALPQAGHCESVIRRHALWRAADRSAAPALHATGPGGLHPDPGTGPSSRTSRPAAWQPGGFSGGVGPAGGSSDLGRRPSRDRGSAGGLGPCQHSRGASRRCRPPRRVHRPGCRRAGAVAANRHAEPPSAGYRKRPTCRSVILPREGST